MRFGAGAEGLEVLGAASIAAEPGEGSLDHPSARQDVEMGAYGKLPYSSTVSVGGGPGTKEVSLTPGCSAFMFMLCSYRGDGGSASALAAVSAEPTVDLATNGDGRWFLRMRGGFTKNVYFCFGENAIYFRALWGFV